jgi:hypothetical protein
MNFVNYSTGILPNLNYNQQIILQSTVHTLYVDSITICNRSNNDIRINLVKKIIGSDSSSTQGFMINNVEVQAPVTGKTDSKSTINLVSLFGLKIFLPVMSTSGITYTTELICYSNGINQNFDCTVDYTTFVETPIT